MRLFGGLGADWGFRGPSWGDRRSHVLDVLRGPPHRPRTGVTDQQTLIQGDVFQDAFEGFTRPRAGDHGAHSA